MMQEMKHTIRLFMLLAALVMGAAGEIKAAITETDIIFSYDNTKGSASVKSGGIETVTGGTKVTITVTPGAGYFINKSNIVVHKLVDPALAPKRAPSLDEPLEVSGSDNPQNEATDYSFVVPDGFKGAQVTITFITKTVASAEVKANDLVYNQQAQALFTVTNVKGGKVKFYKKDGDTYTEIVEATGIGILFEKKENSYEEVDVSAGDPEDLAAGLASGKYVYFYIPKETNANETNTDGTYQQYAYYYYKIIPNNGYSAEDYKQVKVTIKKAKLTGVTLEKTAKQYDNGSELTFGVSEVKAGELTVPAEGYNVSGNTQTAVGSYQATVTGKGNFEGEVKATFHIVATTVTLVSSATSAEEIIALNGHYILTENVSADVFANLYGDTKIFTGTFDGDMYTISGLSHALFNIIDGGTVKNVILDGVGISSGTNVGAIANEATGATRIYNCGILSGSVGGSGDVGGLVGKLNNTSNPKAGARVINCFSYAKITGGNNVGGIVGNNTFASTATDIRTMVMNCMFYGDIENGTNVSPVYGGTNIANLQGGLNTFNYYAYDELKTKAISNNKYNSALAVEEKYLNRFEFYRLLLNSNKKLAAFYATGSVDNANQMAKWVLETADRNIENPKPYPVLKRQGYYPSIINIDAESARPEADRNKGGLLGTLSVTISESNTTTGGQTKPTGASISKSSLTLNRTDKDFARFNFNYDKVQLPYYNDVGTGNYTGNRVVTGWKITAITPVKNDPYKAENYPTTGVTDFPDHNYADRKSSNKDLYSVSGRVFSQGAYFDVPYGVTSITIEPYWGKAYYIADQYYDVVYSANYNTKQGVSQTGTQVTVKKEGDTSYTTTEFNGQNVETSIERALNNINNNMGGWGPTVYDNALVLVGNLHLNTVPQNGTTPFTMMSVDTDNDHEPDYSLIYHHKSRSNITPIRFDFLNIPGTAQAQKPNGASLICNFTIFKARGWFEITNTALVHSDQLEYENGDLGTGVTKIDAPLILLGGHFDQFVSTQSSVVNGHTIYIHVGGNVWINEFGLGTHSDGKQSTPHVPVSVTGGEFPGFYLTGTYKADAYVRTDNAECYISGGYFHEAAGASLEQIDGDVHWQIYNADIDEFFGGGINDAKPIKGNITTDIYNSHVTLFCGGPKFGNMTLDKKNPANNKKVTTNAEGCTFGKFFGAGYGGTSIAKKKYYDKDGSQNWATLQGYYYKSDGTGDRGKYYDGSSTPSSQISGKDYGKKGPGVATDFDYEFFVWSSGATGARLFVKFASFSLAQCNDVESNLTNCTINGDYYGGGSLGKVVGTATSILDNCTVYGNVFGGGFSASLPEIKVRKAGFKAKGDTYYFPNFNQNSGMFEPGEFSDEEIFKWKEAKDDEVTLTNGLSGSDLDNNFIYTNQELTGLGQVAHTNLTIRNNTFVQGKIVEGSSIGGVFGGGDESAVNETTTVNIENEGTRTILNVYGGGNKADVGGKTTVNLRDGIVSGDVFGGGRGDDTHAPTVGETLVILNEPVEEGEGDNKEITYPYNCVVKGRIFGCNDVSGTPLSNAMVHIYKTAGNKSLGITNTPKEDLDNIDDNAHHYHVQAVYGGGNLAAFEPTDKSETSTATTHVIIDGCDMTSIKQVYGGGNAASAPATFVEVNGTYEIGEVFGGGNGKDPIGEGKPNPGANVGYYDYSLRDENGVVVVTEGVVQEKENANTVEKRQANYQYGSGKANVRIYGGKIHRVFGGSNTLGNVRNIALTLLDGQEDCDFSVDEAYGGGKSAPMDGAAKLEMACIPGLKAAYGGAEEAEIHNDVTLNITNGTFDRVFGGNNVQGTITGTITVNIEETGCRPIIIGQLYGGGNQAPYRAAAGKTGPTINVRSFTSIGDIFGGGYGKTATVTGDTHVNINVAEGDFVNQDTDEELTGNRTISFQQFQRNDDGTFVYDETNDPGHTTRLTEPKSINLYLPPHAAGEIGGINNVYGGGNEAEVEGNTQVSIGTEKYVLINTIAAGDDLTGKNYYTRSGAGTAESPYDYELASGPASANTEYYALVKGANIVGNVYGGGNEANVTGSTNVNIGKKEGN